MTASIVLAGIAALTKVEGTAVFFGVLAYELVWRPNRQLERNDLGVLALRVAPFAVGAALFVSWELTATDRLRAASHLGLHMIPRAVQVLRTIVLPYNPANLLVPSHNNRPLALLAALAAVGGAALLVVCIVAAFTRLSVIGLCLLWVGPLLPALSLTDRLQTRYTYLPTLITFVFVASGAAVLLDWLAAKRVPETVLRTGAAISLVGLLAIGIIGTAQASSNLRAAESESRAFSSAVLADHPVLMPRTTIFLIGSPLDAGSAQWVFADPRLGPGITDNVPAIEYAASVAAVKLRGPAGSPVSNASQPAVTASGFRLHSVIHDRAGGGPFGGACQPCLSAQPNRPSTDWPCCPMRMAIRWTTGMSRRWPPYLRLEQQPRENPANPPIH